MWIQRELEKIGLKINITRQTDATFRQLATKGDMQLSIETWQSWVNDPFFHMVPLFHSTSKGTNTAFYSNPALDKILDENYHEPNAEKRLAAAKAAQKIVIDDAVWGMLWYDNWTRVMRNGPRRHREALGHLRTLQRRSRRLRRQPATVGFLGYFLRRLSLVIPTLLGVTIITFTLTYVLPGNPAVVKAGPLVSPEVVKELEKAMGLDQPAWVQYWRYISGVARGDLGQSSSTGRPVLEDFRQRLPATFELTLASLLIALVHRHSARRAVGRPSRHRDRPYRPHRRRRGRRHADLLDRAAGALCLLLSAGVSRRRRWDDWAPGIEPPHGDHRPLRRRQPADRQLEGVGLVTAPAHAARLHARPQRHGADRPHGALDHARDPRIRLHQGRLGGRHPAAPGDLRRCAGQRADPGHHHPGHRVRLPDGRQRGGRERVRLARHRQLRDHLADDQGFRARSSPSCCSSPCSTSS